MARYLIGLRYTFFAAKMRFGGSSVGHLWRTNIESFSRQAINRVIRRISLFNRAGANIVGSAVGLCLHGKNNILVCL